MSSTLSNMQPPIRTKPSWVSRQYYRFGSAEWKGSGGSNRSRPVWWLSHWTWWRGSLDWSATESGDALPWNRKKAARNAASFSLSDAEVLLAAIVPARRLSGAAYNAHVSAVLSCMQLLPTPYLIDVLPTTPTN